LGKQTITDLSEENTFIQNKIKR